MFGVSSRILPVLQLTRMALVFTALSNSLCAYLLLAKYRSGGESYLHAVSFWEVAAIIVISSGLYGFGMSLNDIIDRRRDLLISPGRPIPSGRIRLQTAHVVCLLLLLGAFVAGFFYARHIGQTTMVMLLLLWTAMLIAFYDLMGKYLVSAGILALGLIRFFHATIPAGKLVLVWHPLLLLNHVTIISLICYWLESKRPALTKVHWWTVLLGLFVADAVCLCYAWWRADHAFELNHLARNLSITPRLAYPFIAAIAFAGMSISIRRQQKDSRIAGQSIMLAGLLWLIVYDVLFIAAYVDWLTALAHLLLLPTAYGAVKLMRWWSRIVLLAQKPTYQRAR
jgi:4-hydroxybenzoate polyprenyltransferase